MPETVTAMERQPDALFNFTTGDVLPRGAFRFRLGFLQTNPSIQTAGTGNQIYQSGAAFSPMEGLQFGVDYINHVDPPPRPIATDTPGRSAQVVGGGAHVKYRFYDEGPLTMSAQIAGEFLKFSSTIFGKFSQDYEFVGSAHLPVSYDVAPGIRLHLTPGVSIFPGSRGGSTFYGTVASVGAGVTWQVVERLLVYGTVTQPLTGANTIRSDGSYGRKPVITGGARFLFAPNSSVEVFATNGMGTTPTTSVLTYFPNGDMVMIGAMLNLTFGRGSPEKPIYDRAPGTTLTSYQTALQSNGFTLQTPRTRDRGTVELHGEIGTDGARAAHVSVSPDHFLELGASYEEVANDGSAAINALPGTTGRWSGTFKLQFMDQVDGFPVSLGYTFQAGRDRQKNGVLYMSLPMMREFGPNFAMTVEPKAAFFGSQEIYAVGLGASYSVTPDIRVIGEYTVRDGGRDIWAIGAKTRVQGMPLDVGLHATNAIGAYGINAMTGQSDPKFGLSISVHNKLFR
ncbi:hypothetical protein ATO6_05320 [Oceanicola sp. 22II-s10i]|uniref:hypothetical protein n=1 Tax=Oceanicola sp. 22II-s10i TaxID=1317116 RepID=UPI000B52131C|nr:hypothetical protein [Oceanicola sp. 22II-s10i]OWU86256.1 hypothetical protein ATO6_05320 [Oceanicola sp. 22II-s10i]